MIFNENRKPDWREFERVLRKETPSRPVLAELFLNDHLYQTVSEGKFTDGTERGTYRNMLLAYERLGYDYMPVHLNGFGFRSTKKDTHSPGSKTISLNDGHSITCREDFDRYPWEEPADYGLERLNQIGSDLPDGMKIVLLGPGGVLENVISLMGYDNLCMSLYEDPELVSDVFEQVGSRLLRYYQMAIDLPFVIALFSNDDWGFNTQTMLSPKDMRKYCFPWHRRYVSLAHDCGKYALLHSCGYFNEVIEDVICDMKFDARHSWEDGICPVEDGYERLQGRIAVIGGIDVDLMTRGTPEQVYARSRAMLERTAVRGGYALGTGNSIAPYIPDENYYAMVRAAAEFK